MCKTKSRLGRPYRLAMIVVLVCALPIFACSWRDNRVAVDAMPVDEPPPAAKNTAGIERGPDLDGLDRLDPIELLRRGRERCAREVQSYSCVFLRQERLDGKLTARQSIRVLYREEPQSVYMIWDRDAVRVKRALYVKDRLLNDNGEELALVEPAGAVIRLFVSQVRIPIHGKEARKSGRFTIDQFGFLRVLDRILRDNARLARLGGLRWTCEGSGVIDGRPTRKLIRRLPYTGAGGAYPDARLVVHLDREWLAPVAIYSFADEHERILLGSYVTTQVRLNPALADSSFEF